MKNRYKILGLAMLLLSVMGCQKLDEHPKSLLTPGTFFNSESNLESAVTAMYAPFSVPFYAFGVIDGFSPAFGSDDLATHPGANKEGYRVFDKLAGSAGSDRLPPAWNAPWQVIYQANNVLANYQNVPTTEAVKNKAAGQAYFLRALAYFYLVRTFGELPLITKLEEPSYRPQREPVAKVYDLIVSDLTTAISLLSPTREVGRPTSFSARALLAEVYLTMAGWPLKQTDKYALAAEQSDYVIKNGPYGLLDNYADVFKVVNNNSIETVFALQFNSAFRGGNNIYGNSAMPGDEGGWNDFFPEINFYLNYPAGARKDAVFYTTFKIKQPNGTFVKKNWTQGELGHPYYKKFRDGGIVETDDAIISNTFATSKALDMIRFPLVLLNFAEAKTMANGAPTTEAYNAVNRVRRRAGLGNLPDNLSAIAFRDSVVNERAWEFAGEVGIRWFDMIRREIVEEVVARRDPAENSIPTGTNIKQKYLAPIPSGEMALNPQWQQNPGY